MQDSLTTPRAYGDLAALQARHPGSFKKTRAYALLKEGRLSAKKFGARTIWDLTSADEFIATLPDYGKAA